jgi:hypothetical protein
VVSGLVPLQVFGNPPSGLLRLIGFGPDGSGVLAVGLRCQPVGRQQAQLWQADHLAFDNFLERWVHSKKIDDVNFHRQVRLGQRILQPGK